jgi:hypothetical protein
MLCNNADETDLRIKTKMTGFSRGQELRIIKCDEVLRLLIFVPEMALGLRWQIAKARCVYSSKQITL